MTAVVHGVTVNQVEDCLRGVATKILKGHDWVVYSTETSVQLDRGLFFVRFEIDSDLIQGYPYWWYEISRRHYYGEGLDRPYHMGKATMSFAYKSTIREAVHMLKSEILFEEGKK